MKTPEEKIRVYEDLLHAIQLNAEVAMNSDNVGKLILNICRWSYAHRCGNGELTDEQQEELIDKAFDRLLEY